MNSHGYHDEDIVDIHYRDKGAWFERDLTGLLIEEMALYEENKGSTNPEFYLVNKNLSARSTRTYTE